MENSKNNSEFSLTKPIVVEDDQTMTSYANGLSPEQRVVLELIIDYCKKIIVCRKVAKVEPDPPKLIVHGNWKNDLSIDD